MRNGQEYHYDITAGLKNMEEAIVPAIYDPSRIDFQVMVASEETIEIARKLIRYEGLFVG